MRTEMGWGRERDRWRDRGRERGRERRGGGEGERPGGRETAAAARCAHRTNSMTRDAQGTEGCHQGQGPGVKKTHLRKTPSQDLVPCDPTGKPAEVAGPGTGPLTLAHVGGQARLSVWLLGPEAGGCGAAWGLCDLREKGLRAESGQEWRQGAGGMLRRCLECFS